MKTVVVLGCDGYIGHALTLRLLEKGYRVIGVDDFQRRRHVKEMGSFSATDIQSHPDRLKLFRKIGEFDFLELNIDTDAGEMEHYLGEDPAIGKIHAIINLAQQPSAPFSFKSHDHAINTTINNLIGTLNVLYFMYKYAPDAQLIQIGTMGEYDHSCGVDLPEGIFDLEFRGRVAPNVIFPRRPGSWYHATKVASTYYIDAACRWWGLTATDIMQGVVYGNWTPEIEKYDSPTRLDSDECFGTVVNRFIVQAILNHPLTVFGEGDHKRGYLAINDSIQCLMLALENPPKKGEYRTWNQLDKTYSPNEIAQIITNIAREDFGIEVTVNKIPSPRVEKTESFIYNVDTDKLKALGFKPTRQIADEVMYVLESLLINLDELYPLKEVVMPRITWK